MNILITGAKGQLGGELLKQQPNGMNVSSFDAKELDITKLAMVQELVKATNPQVIINAAAYTQVDKAENEPEQAYRVNVEGIANLAKSSGKSTRIIHISTDFVFDGKANSPYLPLAPTNPLSVYGHTKRQGEQVLLEIAPERSCIVRTAWLYSAGSKNFMDTMLKLMSSKDSLGVVADQRGTPTACHGLALALWRLVQLPHLKGIFQWTDEGETTWHGFACEILRLALKYGLLERTLPINAITTAEYPTPAKRPGYSVMDKTETYDALGLKANPWQQSLEEVIQQRLHNQKSRN
jgi:dTDP-4-dehydrorhamnose reductase